jgi:hypothetical protein
MKTRALLCCVFLFSACGKKDDAGGTAAASGGKATCETVADHVAELRKSADDKAPADPEKDAKRRARMVERCQKHNPPQAVLDCMMGAKTREELRACDKGSESADKGEGGGEGAGDAVAMMSKFTDSMCACKDKACAEGVQKDMAEAAAKMSKDAQPSPDDMKKMQEMAQKFGDCMAKATSAQ